MGTVLDKIVKHKEIESNNDDKCIFWLKLFHSLMPHVDILYNQLQKRTMDPV